jgi:hypothetical protein
MDKQHKALGMNPSTARHRLRMDLLFKMATQLGHTCYRCGEPLTRDTFSLDHKVSWVNHKEPLQMFFDTDNVAFSHQSCNYSDGGKNNIRPSRS